MTNRILVVTSFDAAAGRWMADIFVGSRRECWARGASEALAVADAVRTFRTTRGCRG